MNRRCWNIIRLEDPTNSEENVIIKKADDGADGAQGLFVTRFRGRKAPLCSADKPLMLAIDTAHLTDVCYYCLAQQTNFALLPHSGKNLDDESTSPMRKCLDCKLVRFCNAGCQTNANVEFHRLECPIFQALYPRVIPNHIRAVLRVLLLRQKSKYKQATWSKLKAVPSRVDLFRKAGGKRWEDLCHMAQCAMEYSDTNETFATVIALFCSFLTHAFPITNDLHDPIGMAMHPLFASVRHSCNPNSVIRNARLSCYPDKGIWLQPLQALGINEEITVSYVDPELPTSIRRRILKQDYFIDCCCSACVDELDGQGGLSVFCPLDQALVVYEETSALIQAAAVDTTISGPIEKLRYAVHILLNNAWPVSTQPFPFVIGRLTSAYMDDLQVNIALAYASLLYCAFDQSTYDHMKFHPVSMAHTYQLIRLMITVAEAKFWEWQKLDLVPRKLNLVYMARYLVRELQRAAKDVSSDAITAKLNGMDKYMIHTYAVDSDTDLNDEGKQEAAMDSLRRLGLDVLENLRDWKGEITA